eukprot:snap_masked-scaffold_20-processed-gene-2.28-mRNA-1 protein AED:1.00 eAED:1.00 QI:0/-1/0/0/-1/1/1/0/79
MSEDEENSEREKQLRRKQPHRCNHLLDPFFDALMIDGNLRQGIKHLRTFYKCYKDPNYSTNQNTITKPNSNQSSPNASP